MGLTYIEKLEKRQREKNTLACVSLDTDRALMPQLYSWSPVLEFNRLIIEATNPFICAYKINSAFYFSDSGEPIYPSGEYNLEKTIEFIHKNHPDIPVILDSKIGDISHSAEKYAQEAFDRFGADAVTVNPYLGQDSCQPFLDRKNKGVLILCKTSNPGSADFQDALVYREEFNRELGVWIKKNPQPFYCLVAQTVADKWNKNGNCFLVVGATHPRALGRVRKTVGNMPIFVPAIGRQGGDLEAVIANGLDDRGFGLTISASRSIIYALKDRKYFAQAAVGEAKKLRDRINIIRSLYPAGNSVEYLKTRR